MVYGQMPDDLDIYIDAADPTETGDIKLIVGTSVPMSYCDELDDGTFAWSVQAGSTVGTTINISSHCVEGSGSLFIFVPAGGTGIILLTPDAGSEYNLSGIDNLRFSLKRLSSFAGINLSTNITFHAHFGEAGYGGAGEQTMGNFTLSNSDTWYNKVWDISAVADADKNVVNYFALNVLNNSASKAARVYIDYVYGDPGYSSIRAFDGERVIKLYPKIYTDSYAGTNAALTESIPRRGVPSWIILNNPEAGSANVLLWITGMVDDSAVMAGGWAGDGVGIHNVVDGSFDVSATYSVAGETYHYIVGWDD